MVKATPKFGVSKARLAARAAEARAEAAPAAEPVVEQPVEPQEGQVAAQAAQAAAAAQAAQAADGVHPRHDLDMDSSAEGEQSISRGLPQPDEDEQEIPPSQHTLLRADMLSLRMRHDSLEAQLIAQKGVLTAMQGPMDNILIELKGKRPAEQEPEGAAAAKQPALATQQAPPVQQQQQQQQQGPQAEQQQASGSVRRTVPPTPLPRQGSVERLAYNTTYDAAHSAAEVRRQVLAAGEAQKARQQQRSPSPPPSPKRRPGEMRILGRDTTRSGIIWDSALRITELFAFSATLSQFTSLVGSDVAKTLSALEDEPPFDKSDEAEIMRVLLELFDGRNRQQQREGASAGGAGPSGSGNGCAGSPSSDGAWRQVVRSGRATEAAAVPAGHASAADGSAAASGGDPMMVKMMAMLQQALDNKNAPEKKATGKAPRAKHHHSGGGGGGGSFPPKQCRTCGKMVTTSWADHRRDCDGKAPMAE